MITSHTDIENHITGNTLKARALLVKGERNKLMCLAQIHESVVHEIKVTNQLLTGMKESPMYKEYVRDNISEAVKSRKQLDAAANTVKHISVARAATDRKVVRDRTQQDSLKQQVHEYLLLVEDYHVKHVTYTQTKAIIDSLLGGVPLAQLGKVHSEAKEVYHKSISKVTGADNKSSLFISKLKASLDEQYVQMGHVLEQIKQSDYHRLT